MDSFGPGIGRSLLLLPLVAIWGMSQLCLGPESGLGDDGALRLPQGQWVGSLWNVRNEKFGEGEIDVEVGV